MATKAKASKGTTLTRGGVLIAEITTISGPTGTAPAIDATSHDSVSAEFVGGMPDAGEVSFDFNWVGSDAPQQSLDTDREAGTLSTYVLTVQDHATNPSTVTFTALVTACSLNPGGTGDKLSGSCTLKISGKPTRTYAPA